MPKLTTLTLYFQDLPVAPYLDKSAAEHIFEYLSLRKSGHPLKSLVIHHVSTERYGGFNQDPGHTVFRCTTDPLTSHRAIRETQERGGIELGRDLYKHFARRDREDSQGRQDSLHIHPPSVLLAEINANNAFWQSIAPGRLEYQITPRDYEIRTRDDPSRLARHEEYWRQRTENVMVLTDVFKDLGYKEQIQEALAQQESLNKEDEKQLNSFGDPLRVELDRRCRDGWDLWDMKGVKPRARGEGFLYDRLLE